MRQARIWALAAAAATEIAGLFVDDVRYAAIILAWLVAGRLLLPWLGVPSGVAPVLLFAGLAAILVEGAWDRAQASRRQ